MALHTLVNTSIFSQTARDFKKNGDIYTRAPHGSRDYYSFWEEEEKRCRYGYSAGGLWIPGRYYFYLNHFQIYKVPDHVVIENMRRRKAGLQQLKTSEKIWDFPRFWEIDYEWWMFKHISWYGGEFMGVKSDGGKHLCALKTRGCGFSFKEAADGVYNYTFIPGSKSYYFAATEPFLIGDAIMDKVQSGLDFTNKYSTYWKQNRQKKFGLMHQKASYLDSESVERGTFSEIIAQIVDKADKTRGKRGRKITFEEAGSFPNLERAVEISQGSLRDGDVYVGQMSIFGTGGETGPSIQGLENIFNYPEAWDMLAFPNVYEDGVVGTECGYFVPCWRANNMYIDMEGNIDMQGALRADDIMREKKKRTGKPKDLDGRKAEYPRTPGEALQRLSGNGFNIAEIDAQIKRLQTNHAMQAQLRYGKMVTAPSHADGVEFVVMPKLKARPIEEYPHTSLGSELDGCVTILQEPITDQNGNVYDNVYEISFDAYYKEDAEDTTSLFSVKVWKTENAIDPSYVDLPVAWWAGRPKKLDDAYFILFALSRKYRAKVQGEISGGGQGVVNYAKTSRILHLVHNEPQMVHNKEIASKSAGNSFLMNMNDDRKRLGLQYLEDWHMMPRGIDEKGNITYNIHWIYDIAWLRELKKHNPEKGNFDRISDAIVGMFMLKEKRAMMVKTRRKNKSFYTKERLLYGGSGTETGAFTTSY